MCRLLTSLGALAALLLVLNACGRSEPAAPVVYADEGPGAEILVHRGDTAWGIAQTAGVPLGDLIEANGLAPPYLLQIGQVLRLPSLRLHKVRAGESLSSVAEFYNVGRYDIARLNRLVEPYRLHPNQILKIPGGRDAEVRIADAAARGVLTAAESVPLPPPRPTRLARHAPPPASPPPSRSVEVAAIPRPTPVEPSGKGLIWPVAGRVVSGFGPKDGGLHNDGINIVAPAGSPVLAAELGEVVYAGNELRGFGNLVLIRHPGGLTSAYAHLDRITVQRGEQVQRGQTIGSVGQSGGISPAQLHFEIRRGRQAVDPVELLGGPPERALSQESGLPSRPARS